jgi:hypothetical protein
MANVLNETRLKSLRALLRVEAATLFFSGILFFFNQKSTITALVAVNVQSVGSTHASAILDELHPIFALTSLVMVAAGIKLYYMAQSATDPALKRISFLLIAIYAGEALTLISAPKTHKQLLVVVTSVLAIFCALHLAQIGALFVKKVKKA